MNRRSEVLPEQEDTLEKIIGLGERSIKKSYYPQLKEKISKLEENQRFLEEKTAALMNILEDLEEERAAHDELIRLFDVTNDLLCIVDNNGRFVRLSPSWERLTGYLERELLGKDITGFVHPDDCTSFKELFSELNSLESLNNYDGRFLRKDGSEIWLSWNAEPIPDRMIFVCAAHDVTERKMIEDSLRRMNKKMSLLSNITRHDLINKLTVIQGYIELINQKSSEIEVVGMSEKAELSLHDLEKDISFMKEYESMGESEPSWELVSQSLNEVLDYIDTGSIKVESDLDGLYIYSDRMFKKVFYNLLNNALIHGGKNLSLIKIGYKVINGEVVIRFSDDGIGIPDKMKEKIFERGYKKQHGFGLFLSREILGITGITIYETGSFEKGSTFEIHIPKGNWKID